MYNAFSGFGSLLAAGGAMVVPILLSSVWSVAILIEGAWLARKARNRLDVLPIVDMKGLNLNDLRGRDPVTAIFRWRVENPQASAKEAIEVNARLFSAAERRFSWLNTIAAIAPLFGLLGTVFGMISIFHTVSASKPTNPIAALSGGIAEALVATAGGLIVALIASVGYHYLSNAFSAVEADTEAWLTLAPKRQEEPRLAR